MLVSLLVTIAWVKINVAENTVHYNDRKEWYVRNKFNTGDCDE